MPKSKYSGQNYECDQLFSKSKHMTMELPMGNDHTILIIIMTNNAALIIIEFIVTFSLSSPFPQKLLHIKT